MGFCCGRRLVSSLVPDESEDEACDEEERPCHVVFSKRQGMHELIHSRSRELQHLQSVIESRNKGESRCQRIDLLASSETLVEECQDDQGNSQRVQEKQYRDSALDDGRKTEEGDQERETCKEGSPCLTMQHREELMEISSAGSNQADGSREACQDDDESQKDSAGCAEVVSRSAGKNRSACFHMAQNTDRISAQNDQGCIDDKHEECGNEAGVHSRTSHFLIRLYAEETNRFHDNDAEDKTSQAVHRVVAFNQCIRESLQRSRISSGRFHPWSHREEDRRTDQNEEEKKQHRRDDLANTRNKLGRSDSQPSGQKEENENEDIQPDCFLCIRQEWSRRNFKRNRSRTGNREERSDRQVQKRAEQHTVHRMDTRSQLLKTCARITNRKHSRKRKADTRN